ncbi:uncharacterized protein BKA55DRAFT_743171 [Fusarium redolens]|uniref:Uncharacterized protein n=1 Tax=Fusarium redolens TaxID=48865 RepID=A0A9P9G0V5_FUSRE|nr:uncharacterized protein BKA55DRAFT_743171 [Fusarium redolens]KAH7230461.1 hypothetical protein BKA55DRAFT_743171 [Fusarium redolens]
MLCSFRADVFWSTLAWTDGAIKCDKNEDYRRVASPSTSPAAGSVGNDPIVLDDDEPNEAIKEEQESAEPDPLPNIALASSGGSVDDPIELD